MLSLYPITTILLTVPVQQTPYLISRNPPSSSHHIGALRRSMALRAAAMLATIMPRPLPPPPPLCLPPAWTTLCGLGRCAPLLVDASLALFHRAREIERPLVAPHPRRAALGTACRTYYRPALVHRLPTLSKAVLASPNFHQPASLGQKLAKNCTP